MNEIESSIKFVSENTAQIYLPSVFVSDSTYPFPRESHKVIIRISGSKLVVELDAKKEEK